MGAIELTRKTRMTTRFANEAWSASDHRWRKRSCNATRRFACPCSPAPWPPCSFRPRPPVRPDPRSRRRKSACGRPTTTSRSTPTLLQARIRKKGYVSGIAAGSLLDKKTGRPRPRLRPAHHGLPDGPRLERRWLLARRQAARQSAQALRRRPANLHAGEEARTRSHRGKDFVAVRLRFTFTKPAKGFKAGSTWEQTLVFQPGLRYFLSRRTHHQRQRRGRPLLPHRHARPHQAQGRRHLHAGLPELPRQPIPAAAFAEDFAPDAKFLYQREAGQGARADDPGVPGEAWTASRARGWPA